jgi:hypothetical protein
MIITVWDVGDAIQSLIRSRRAVDPRQLADPSVPLHELSPTDTATRWP